jgi:hypothetical protein
VDLSSMPASAPRVEAKRGSRPTAHSRQTPQTPTSALHVRRPFETELGLDLGPVRVHTHPTASASARALGARAYTIGSDIAFAPGNYQPASGVGRELLAHELAHVAQQTAAGVPVLAAFPDIGFWDVVDVVSPIGGEIGRASGLTGSDVLEGAGRYILGDTLWDVLSAFAGGFKEGLGSASKQQLDRLSDKFDNFGVADAYGFIGGYTAGVFKGLWYELKDLFDAIKTLLGLPEALNEFLTHTLPQLAVRLRKAMAGPGGLSERLKKLSDAYNRNPAAVMEQAEKLLDTARAAVLRPADPDAQRRKRTERGTVPIHRTGPGPLLPAELRLGRPPRRVVRAPHREGGRESADARGLQARRAADADGRAGRRAVDQLLPHTLRHERRADQLSARDGVPSDRADPALGPTQQPPVELSRTAESFTAKWGIRPL